MTIVGWLQIGLVLGLVLVAVRPLGALHGRRIRGAADPSSAWAAGTRLLPSCRRRPGEGTGLAGLYAGHADVFGAGLRLLYAIQRLQAFLPLNPQGFDGVPPDLAFNTAISFVTNTNWQAYGGETTMSHSRKWPA